MHIYHEVYWARKSRIALQQAMMKSSALELTAVLDYT